MDKSVIVINIKVGSCTEIGRQGEGGTLLVPILSICWLVRLGLNGRLTSVDNKGRERRRREAADMKQQRARMRPILAG